MHLRFVRFGGEIKRKFLTSIRIWLRGLWNQWGFFLYTYYLRTTSLRRNGELRWTNTCLLDWNLREFLRTLFLPRLNNLAFIFFFKLFKVWCFGSFIYLKRYFRLLLYYFCECFRLLWRSLGWLILKVELTEGVWHELGILLVTCRHLPQISWFWTLILFYNFINYFFIFLFFKVYQGQTHQILCFVVQESNAKSHCLNGQSNWDDLFLGEITIFHLMTNFHLL